MIRFGFEHHGPSLSFRNSASSPAIARIAQSDGRSPTDRVRYPPCQAPNSDLAIGLRPSGPRDLGQAPVASSACPAVVQGRDQPGGPGAHRVVRWAAAAHRLAEKTSAGSPDSSTHDSVEEILLVPSARDQASHRHPSKAMSPSAQPRQRSDPPADARQSGHCGEAHAKSQMNARSRVCRPTAHGSGTIRSRAGALLAVQVSKPRACRVDTKAQGEGCDTGRGARCPA